MNCTKLLQSEWGRYMSSCILPKVCSCEWTQPCTGIVQTVLVCSLPTQETDKAAFLVRQHVHFNLYDRIRWVCQQAALATWSHSQLWGQLRLPHNVLGNYIYLCVAPGHFWVWWRRNGLSFSSWRCWRSVMPRRCGLAKFHPHWLHVYSMHQYYVCF